MNRRPRFTLRYAAHLGFRSFDQPLFARAAPSPLPADQIALAAEQGFADVQDPWLSDRDAVGQDAVAAAIATTGLAAGTPVVGARADLARPLWLPETGDEARRLDAALADATRLGATDLVAVPAARPGLLLTGFAQAARMVRAVAHPAVRLVFDTGHLLTAGKDPLRVLESERDSLGPVRIAGHPGRCKRAQSETPLAPVLEALVRQGHDGLVELEHLWREEGAAAEAAGLAWLDALEPRLGQIGERRNSHDT